MKTGVGEALVLSIAMAAAIFFCRIFPFLFFRGKNGSVSGKRAGAFLSFVEKTVPPAAMTVLTFNSLASPVQANYRELLPVLAAAAFTAIVHLWRRNPLISIFGGTALYMLLFRFFL
ncbi:MAG: AzlD domain-containing protein [Treponema sp.]|nr:AzlD domain-containing protein [Treponema sp.]